jgi:hypothetical protein
VIITYAATASIISCVLMTCEGHVLAAFIFCNIRTGWTVQRWRISSYVVKNWQWKGGGALGGGGVRTAALRYSRSKGKAAETFWKWRFVELLPQQDRMMCNVTSRCLGGCKSPSALKQGVGRLPISKLFISYICFSGKETAGVRLARFGAACSGEEAACSSSSTSSCCTCCADCFADAILVYRIRFKPLALCTGSCHYTFGAVRRNGMRAKRFGCFGEEWFCAKFFVEEGSSRGCIVHVTEVL